MEPLLPLSESQWWYDTTYPQYAEDALIKSQFYAQNSDNPNVLDIIDEQIDPVLNENAYNELVEGTSNVSMDTWVTGQDTGEYNNRFRTANSVVYLTSKQDLSLADILENELEDQQFVSNVNSTIDYISPRRGTAFRRSPRNNTSPRRGTNTVTPYSFSPRRGTNNTVLSPRSNGTVSPRTGINVQDNTAQDTVIDSTLLGISPVNMQGRDMSPRRSSWLIHDGTVFSPTLSNVGTNDNIVANLGNYQRDYEKQSTSERYIRVDRSTSTGDEDVTSIVQLIDSMSNRMIDKPVIYNGIENGQDDTVLRNSLTARDEDGKVQIMYKEVVRSLLNQ